MENENEAVAVTVPNQATELNYDYVFGGWWVKVLYKGDIFLRKFIRKESWEVVKCLYKFFGVKFPQM